MLLGYIKPALRNLARYRLYAFINIAGLSLGLCVFLFSSLLTAYENNHDHMFSKRARTFTVGSIFAPTSQESVKEFPVVRTAFGPLLRAEIKEAELVVRVPHRDTLFKVGNSVYYEGMRFAERGFTRIFDFQYIHGNARALDDPRGFIVTESAAKKFFGRVNVMGEKVSIEHKYEVRVTAVIRDIAPDSHFNSSLLPRFHLTFIAPLEALIAAENFKREGDHHTLDPADMTYVLLPPNRSGAWLQKKADAVFARHTTPAQRQYISGIKIRPLIEANIIIWAAMGFPLLESVRLLGILVLLVACANYTNLATAQNFGRALEVGLRKTFGARRPQLLVQFLLESVTLTAFAMLIALAGIELLVPAFNAWTGKAVQLDYGALLPRLFLVTIAAGLLAGAYPAFLVSRRGAMENLRNTIAKGPRGNRFRAFMVAVQFSISIFILSMVMIIFFQNRQVLEISNIWPKWDTVILDRINKDEIVAKREELRRAMNALPGVRSMTFSSGVPFFETSHTQKSRRVTPNKDDLSRAFTVDIISMDSHFLREYDIELKAGRYPDTRVPGDVYQTGARRLNVVVNRAVIRKLGFTRDQDALGKSLHVLPEKNSIRPDIYAIIGIMPDLYFVGPQSRIHPMAFFIRPELDYYASLRLEAGNREQTLRDIDNTWARVIKNYPIRRRYLGSYFNFFFHLLRGINSIIAVFAGVALALALVGLFGLAAFMARMRTKEIGIRKVMGASESQITRLLIWRFSRPVLWSLLIALPAAYSAAGLYLDFFPERFAYVVPVILLAGAGSVLSAWAVVAGHAARIARTTPVRSLRYE